MSSVRNHQNGERRMPVWLSAVSMAVGTTISATVSAGVVNGNFSVPERNFVLQSESNGEQCDISGMCDGQLGNLPGWTFIDLGEQFSIVDVSEFDELSGTGNTVGRITENDDALTGDDDAIAQCVDLEMDDVAGAEFALSSHVTAQFPKNNEAAENRFGELPAEVAVKFYSESDCNGELNEDFGLDGDLVDLAAGDDRIFFQRFDVVRHGIAVEEGVEAIEIAPWEWGEARLEGTISGEEPMSAAIFIATGDQMEDGGEPTGPRQLYIDDIQFTVDGVNGGTNLAANGQFDEFPNGATFEEFFSERAPWPDDDQGPFGWYLSDLQTDGGAATETADNLPGFDPVSGDRVFVFRGIDDISSGNVRDANDDALDQCVDIRKLEGKEFSYSAQLRSNEGGGRVEYALMWEFHYDYDKCLTRIDTNINEGLGPNDSEFQDNDDPLDNASMGEIQNAAVWEQKSTSPVAVGPEDRYARLSIRVVDTQSSEDEDLFVYIDDVRIADPDEVADNGGDSGSSAGSSSSGCTTGNLSDPTLPGIALLALLGLLTRRGAGAAK